MASNVGSDLLRERELAQWLEQRLDSTGGLWAASRNLCSAMTKELLANVPSCFVDLHTHIKLKILMSVLYFPKRNVEQWRDEIEDVLSLACQDTDEWVQTLAELLKEYPTTSGISFNMDNDGSQFTKTLQELRKLLRRHVKGPCGQILPLDAAYMNKQAAQTTWGGQTQQVSAASSRYFSLKRKPKAAAQRIEFLQKSADVATQMKYKNGTMSSTLPIRHKNSVRRMDDDTPLKGFPSQSHSKSTPGFRPPSKPMNRQTSLITTPAAPRRLCSSSGSGVKLIDINETPQALEKKRKTMEAEEKAAKKAAKEEMKRQKDEERLQKKMQRDAKIQRSHPQDESHAQELLSTASSESALSPVEKLTPIASSALIQPTPDYAAELFEGAISAARANANIPLPPSTAGSIFPVPAPSAAAIPSLENHMVAVSQSRVCLPNALEASANLINSAAPHYFGSVAPAVRNADSAPPIEPSVNADLHPTINNISAAKTPTKTGSIPAATKTSASKSKKRKTGTAEDKAAEQSAASDQQPQATVVDQSAPSISSQAPVHHGQQQFPQMVRFQYGGTTATSAPVNGGGLGQMARNLFVPQQGANQQVVFASPQQVLQQPDRQHSQPLAPRTIVFVHQPVPTSGLSQVTLNVYNSVSTASAGGSRPTLQQVHPPPAQSQVLASFTPSVIQQTPPSTMLPQVAGSVGTSASPTLGPPVAVTTQQQLAAAAESADSKKPTFTITKDVMMKAQEMFRTANKLSRPEKALILGFMAGNRENPCPQMGRVLTVRLSESQDVQTQSDGSTKHVMVETYFQMNYDTGEWKQIRKIRPLREGEGQTS